MNRKYQAPLWDLTCRLPRRRASSAVPPGMRRTLSSNWVSSDPSALSWEVNGSGSLGVEVAPGGAASSFTWLATSTDSPAAANMEIIWQGLGHAALQAKHQSLEAQDVWRRIPNPALLQGNSTQPAGTRCVEGSCTLCKTTRNMQTSCLNIQAGNTIT